MKYLIVNTSNGFLLSHCEGLDDKRQFNFMCFKTYRKAPMKYNYIYAKYLQFIFWRISGFKTELVRVSR